MVASFSVTFCKYGPVVILKSVWEKDSTAKKNASNKKKCFIGNIDFD
jgi:hypothetical protein